LMIRDRLKHFNTQKDFKWYYMDVNFLKLS
jgi:hypothetical protein